MTRYEHYQQLIAEISPIATLVANDWDVWRPFRVYESDIRRYCAVVVLGPVPHLVLFSGEKGFRRFEDQMLSYSTGDHVIQIVDLDTGEPVSFELRTSVAFAEETQVEVPS